MDGWDPTCDVFFDVDKSLTLGLLYIFTSNYFPLLLNNTIFHFWDPDNYSTGICICDLMYFKT